MMDVFKMIERVADTDSTVLVLGESGTGKELVAKALHYNSRRQFQSFVPVNCAALPENLLESELFGHRKGAFTGAISDKAGLFQEADGGTIFLDEIGSMPMVLQSRLLRVLQEREIRRVGDNLPIFVDVRVVAATNEPLEKKIKEGTFREDLYYRLNVIPINLPSLRERREDIPLLVTHFVREKVHARSGKLIQLTRSAMDVLCAHEWPGNVRELENAIERASALCEEGIIRVADLPPLLQKLAPAGAAPEQLYPIRSNDVISGGMPVTITPGSATSSAPAPAPSLDSIKALKEYLREQEQSYINRVLARAGNDKERTAQMLGVSLATLYRKLSEEGEAL